jgi:ring-1,2-phenylacetyl-CoA epoxidase subunit PaaC
MEKALEELWPYTGEMFEPTIYEKEAINNRVGVSVSDIKNNWLSKIEMVLKEATLPVPKNDVWMHAGGKNGIHTEHLGYLLAEMQFLQRAYPGCQW